MKNLKCKIGATFGTLAIIILFYFAITNTIAEMIVTSITLFLLIILIWCALYTTCVDHHKEDK